MTSAEKRYIKASKVKKAFGIWQVEFGAAWACHLGRLAGGSSDGSLAFWEEDCKAAKAKYQAAIE